MKVVITCETYPPSAGGVARAAYEQAHGLARSGYRVAVITGAVPGVPPRYTEEDVEVARFAVRGSGRLGDSVHGEVDEFRAYAAGLAADVYVAHGWQSWSTHLGLEVAAKTHAKRVLVSHGVSANSGVGLRGTLLRPLWLPYLLGEFPRTLRGLDRLVVLSPRVDRDRFLDHLMATKCGCPVSVIPNGADLEAHDRASEDFSKKFDLSGKRIVLGVGKFHWLKNERALVKAFARAAPPNTVLVLVGPSENLYAKNLRRLAARSNLPEHSNVLVLPGLGKEDILAAYRAADLYVSASLTECFPLAVLDAMASRTPFVSVDVGNVSELPGGVVVRTARDLAWELRALLSDDSRRVALGHAGREACERTYNWKSVCEMYAHLLQSLG